MTASQEHTQSVQDTPTRSVGKVEAWILAARPKTLAAAAAPVIVALALAWRDFATDPALAERSFQLVPALSCLLFAIFAQIAANFINDYADFQRGADDQRRKGPQRAVANGWISPKAMLLGTFVALAVACLCGLATLFYGGWPLFWVGLISCVFCLLYSCGPLPLSYIGLGDVLVVAFFGVVAIAFTYYAQTQRITLDAVLLGLAIGFACDNILVANNYRDRDEDRANRKWTLIALLGERFGRYFYLANGLIALTLATVVFARQTAWSLAAILAIAIYLAAHLSTWSNIARYHTGVKVARVLPLSARNLLILSILVSVAIFK
ncbi:MAG: 1,4-dihydroxy-2-naphthoate octaprenyltransferase [Planctomycetia bacterium]|nr:1,4-dihydroxy-2-naphthoate octaprenyltransferase [Planctomycetia bacterium]